MELRKQLRVLSRRQGSEFGEELELNFGRVLAGRVSAAEHLMRPAPRLVPYARGSAGTAASAPCSILP